MTLIDMQQLLQTLDAETRQELQRAVKRCAERGGTEVFAEDLLLGLLNRPQGLLANGLREIGKDAGILRAELQWQIENRPSHNTGYAPQLVQWLQDALQVANQELGHSEVEQVALIITLLRDPDRYTGTL